MKVIKLVMRKYYKGVKEIKVDGLVKSVKICEKVEK